LADRRQGLKEQLELLWELQKIDLELKNIKEEKDRYPKEMKNRRLRKKGFRRKRKRLNP
jgi:predicted  nucleic acid-binding Zn-ribbon protein